MANKEIVIRDTVPGTTRIRRTGPDRWILRQRFLGDPRELHVENQCPSWVRIENPGKAREIEIVLFWSVANNWQNWRLFGYQQVAGRYSAVRGETDWRSTRWKITVPKGESHFGAFPWYGNRDADALMEKFGALPGCHARNIGETAAGRPIRCLTLEGKTAGRPAVVVFARMHATESSGSFAVEAIARFLAETDEGRRMRENFSFHLFPATNPDGIEQGLKFPRWGPKEELDLSLYGADSKDPTAVALRHEIGRLKPACLLDFHSYLMPVPALFFFEKEKDFSFSVLDRISGLSDTESSFYCKWMRMEGDTRVHSFKKFYYRNGGSHFMTIELSWNFGLLPEEVGRSGCDIFRAAVLSLPAAGKGAPGKKKK